MGNLLQSLAMLRNVEAFQPVFLDARLGTNRLRPEIIPGPTASGGSSIHTRPLGAADLPAPPECAPMVFLQPGLLIVGPASLPDPTSLRDFRARRCRFPRCGSATRDRSASRRSCRRRSG